MNGYIPKIQPEQGCSEEQVRWLNNWHWNITTPLSKKLLAVLKGNARMRIKGKTE